MRCSDWLFSRNTTDPDVGGSKPLPPWMCCGLHTSAVTMVMLAMPIGMATAAMVITVITAIVAPTVAAIIVITLVAHVVAQRAASTAAGGCANQAAGVAAQLLADNRT